MREEERKGKNLSRQFFVVVVVRCIKGRKNKIRLGKHKQTSTLTPETTFNKKKNRFFDLKTKLKTKIISCGISCADTTDKQKIFHFLYLSSNHPPPGVFFFDYRNA